MLYIHLLQASDGKEKDNVRVAVRCRPLNPDEVQGGRGVVVTVDQLRGEVSVKVGRPEVPPLALYMPHVRGGMCH